jgi:two-component system catabolic regulation response regulator CreB
MPPKILVIEDEPAIADNILFAFETEKFKTVWRPTGKEGLSELAKSPFDLIVLDVGLPDTDGFELCREIRKKSRVPILFLTARAGEVDRVLGLELGADDYMVKPFSPRELAARVKAILRRTSPGPETVPTAKGPFALDEGKQGILYKGRLLPLSKHEYLLLKALLSQPGRVYSREKLMEMAWESPGSSQERTVDAHVKSLRKKLRAAGAKKDPLKTQRGFGYSLDT